MSALHKLESTGRFIAAGCAKVMQIFHAVASAHGSAVWAMTEM
jgi:hypothetical protein